MFEIVILKYDLVVFLHLMIHQSLMGSINGVMTSIAPSPSGYFPLFYSNNEAMKDPATELLQPDDGQNQVLPRNFCTRDGYSKVVK